MIPVKINKNQVQYDQEHDVLHVYLFPDHLSVDDEEYPGIIIRRSVTDDRITGITIMDYSKRDPKMLQILLPLFNLQDVDYVKYN